MDIWGATDKQIKEIAEKNTGGKAIAVYRPSGLYAWVTVLINGVIKSITVYESEV
jgi:hypothetical protein